MMRIGFMLALAACAVLLLPSHPASARIQRDLVCWVPDYEFPVDCDDEDD